MGDRRGLDDIESMAMAADYMSLGDEINVQLRTN